MKTSNADVFCDQLKANFLPACQLCFFPLTRLGAYTLVRYIIEKNCQSLTQYIYVYNTTQLSAIGYGIFHIIGDVLTPEYVHGSRTD